MNKQDLEQKVISIYARMAGREIGYNDLTKELDNIYNQVFLNGFNISKDYSEGKPVPDEYLQIIYGRNK